MAYAERELATTEFGGAEESPATHQIDKSLDYKVSSTNEASLSLEYRIEPVTRPIDVRGGGEFGTFEFGGAVAPKVFADIEKSLQYTVDTTQSIDKALKYAIADTQSIDKSLQYAVEDTNTIDKSLKYTVDTTQSIDKSLKYAIGDTQTIDKSLQYTVEATKTIDKSLEYRVVLDSQTIDKALKYNVRTIRIKINGTERRSEFSNDSLTVENNLFSEPDFATLSFVKSSSSPYTPSSGDEIEVYDNGTKIFAGPIIDIHRELRGKVEEYLLEFKDWIEELDNIIVAETYTNQTVNQIVSDINSNYLTGYDISNVNDTTSINRVVFDNISVSEALDKLTDLSNKNWYVDPDKKIYVFADSDIQSNFDIDDTSGNYNWHSLQVDEDLTQIRNKVSVQGQNIPLVTVQDSTSQNNYGVREYVERDDQITTTEEANQKANAILSAYKDPIYKAKFTTRKPTLYAGQEINIKSSERSITARDYTISKVIFRSNHPHDFEYEVTAKTQREVSLENFIQGERDATLSKTPIADQGFLSEISFSATNFETISWNSGDITLGDGTTYSINGSSLTLTGDHIIYLDPDTSQTELQDSTNFADGIGPGKVPLAYASKQSVTTKSADIIPVAFGRQIQLDGGVHITDRSVIADQIAANTITANEVAANTITGSQISAIESSDMDSVSLPNTGVLMHGGGIIGRKSGSTTFKLDASTGDASFTGDITGSTITGSTIQTSTSGGRIELDDINDRMSLYDTNGNERLRISDDSLAMVDTNGNNSGVLLGGTSSISITAGSGHDLLLNTLDTTDDVTIGVGGSPFINADGVDDNIEFWKDLIPKELSLDIGSSSNVWQDIYSNRLLNDSSLIMDMSITEGPALGKPLGFNARSSTPGNASNYAGYMYYDTTKDNIVYSDGSGWFEVNATSY